MWDTSLFLWGLFTIIGEYDDPMVPHLPLHFPAFEFIEFPHVLFIKSEKFMNIPSSHIQPAIPPMESYSPWLSVTSPPRSVGSPAWRCSPRCGAPAGGGSDSRGSAARSKSRELCPNLLGGRWRSEKWHLFGVYHDIIWYRYYNIYMYICIYMCVYIYVYIYVYLGLWKTKCWFFVPTIKTCAGL